MQNLPSRTSDVSDCSLVETWMLQIMNLPSITYFNLSVAPTNTTPLAVMLLPLNFQKLYTLNFHFTSTQKLKSYPDVILQSFAVQYSFSRVTNEVLTPATRSNHLK